MDSMRTLSRNQLKAIKGGEALGCLVCTTPGGTEYWDRIPRPEPPHVQCHSIYPVYNLDDIVGIYFDSCPFL